MSERGDTSGEASTARSRQRAPSVLARLGLGGEAPDARFAWVLVAVFLSLYVMSFAAFYPRYATNHDEAHYIRQARLLLEGTSAVVQIDPVTGAERSKVMGSYPVATALITAPFIAAFGGRAAFAVACLALIVAVVITARWLQHEGRSPAFALLLLGFPPMLVMARIAMSDVPSTAWVVLGFWLFWRGLDAESRAGAMFWLAAGFVAGASLTFRASNPVLFVPLFAGTVLRRELKAGWLVVGGVAGLAMRLATQAVFFGDAMFERSAYRWSPETIDERLWLYLVALLVFIPGGLVFSMLYRGRRRPEIIATIVVFVTLYLLQAYSTVETSVPKRLILGLRYLLPVLPMMIFAMAESLPRLWSDAMAKRAPAGRALPERIAAGLVWAWLAGIAVAVLAVHPAFASWGRTQDLLRETIATHVPNDAVLITNRRATQKFIPELDRHFSTVAMYKTNPEQVDALVARHGQVYLVLLDRSDSEWWRGETEVNHALLNSLTMPQELVVRVRPTATDDLRIWKLTPSEGASDESSKPAPAHRFEHGARR